MVLQNFISLVSEVPATMHFVSAQKTDRDITDPDTRSIKTLTTYQFIVDELNGAQVTATFSVTSEKLAAQLDPYVQTGRLHEMIFTITKHGSGFTTSYEVDVRAR